MMESLNALALVFAKNFGHWRLSRLHWAWKSAWSAIQEGGDMAKCLSTDFWMENGPCTASEALELAHAFASLEAEALMAANLKSKGIGLLSVGMKDYPASFSGLSGQFGPPALFFLGDTKLLSRNAIGIVGPREASQHARGVAAQIARLAVSKGFSVVNGFAEGTDRIAVHAALSTGGRAVVFLPYGLLLEGNRLRPVWKKIKAGELLVLSSFFPLARFSGHLAMTRNRWVAQHGGLLAAPGPLNDGGTRATLEMAARMAKPTWLVEERKPSWNWPIMSMRGMKVLARQEIEAEFEAFLGTIANSEESAGVRPAQMRVV